MRLIIANKKYSSWSLRPWLLMKHFGIPFEETLIPLDQPDTSAKILEVSPSGKVPALTDGSIRVWDSLAICEYLAEKFADKKMWPANTTDRAHARSISNEMHSSFTTLRTMLPMKCHEVFKTFEIPNEVQGDIQRITRIWDDALEKSRGPYLFGEFSIADAMFAPVVFRFMTYGVKVDGKPAEYMETMLKHPGMKEWRETAEREQLRLTRYG